VGFADFRFCFFSAQDAKKIENDSNHDDRSDYTQATARAPPRMAIISAAYTKQQKQDYDYK
jgi:hypothetical protein